MNPFLTRPSKVQLRMVFLPEIVFIKALLLYKLRIPCIFASRVINNSRKGLCNFKRNSSSYQFVIRMLLNLKKKKLLQFTKLEILWKLDWKPDGWWKPLPVNETRKWQNRTGQFGSYAVTTTHKRIKQGEFISLVLLFRHILYCHCHCQKSVRIYVCDFFPDINKIKVVNL